MKFGNGDSFRGDWKDDRFVGKGKYRYANGDVYTGEWKDEMKDGTGSFRYLMD